MARRYAIGPFVEARAYLEDPPLGAVAGVLFAGEGGR
jgi:hypothetical protein